jgi:hypothetical protein
MKRIFYAAATVVAAGALALTGAGAAGAATAAHPNATAACHAVFSQCATPVIAVSSVSANNLTPADDFALSYAGPTPAVAYGNIETNFQNNAQDGTEDWAWIQDGTVPAAGGGGFKFTSFDRANFAGKPVYELEYAPSGTDSQLCLTISSRTRPNGAVLGKCISAAQQSFIVTQTAPGLESLTAAPTAAPTAAYQYAFDVSQNLSDVQHHLALLAPHANIAGELIAAGTPVHVAVGAASLNEWGSTP